MMIVCSFGDVSCLYNKKHHQTSAPSCAFKNLFGERGHMVIWMLTAVFVLLCFFLRSLLKRSVKNFERMRDEAADIWWRGLPLDDLFLSVSVTSYQADSVYFRVFGERVHAVRYDKFTKRVCYSPLPKPPIGNTYMYEIGEEKERIFLRRVRDTVWVIEHGGEYATPPGMHEYKVIEFARSYFVLCFDQADVLSVIVHLREEGEPYIERLRQQIVRDARSQQEYN